MSAMCREKKTARPLTAQKAFALPAAIFLLVVLAALGAFMLLMSSVQHTTAAQDVQGTRAYQAARAGIEWGVYQVMQPENANYGRSAAYTAPYACPGAMTAALPGLDGTLAGFFVAVSCTQTTHNEGGNTIRIYQVTSTATFGQAGSIARVERQITATVSTCRQPSILPELNGANCG